MLEKILKELQYQTKLMENLYEKKDERKTDLNQSFDALKKELAKHPGLAQNKLMEQVFSLVKEK